MDDFANNKIMYKLGESNIHGHGLIATENIKANTDVGLSHIGIGLVNNKVVAEKQRSN